MMATKREIEIARQFFYYGYHEPDEIHPDDYAEIIERDFPFYVSAERKEFEQTLHLLDEAHLMKFPDAESSLEELWQFWKAARGIE